MRNNWTSWQVHVLNDLVIKGYNVKQISAFLGMSTTRIKNKLYRMNVEGK